MSNSTNTTTNMLSPSFSSSGDSGEELAVALGGTSEKGNGGGVAPKRPNAAVLTSDEKQPLLLGSSTKETDGTDMIERGMTVTPTTVPSTSTSTTKSSYCCNPYKRGPCPLLLICAQMAVGAVAVAAIVTTVKQPSPAADVLKTSANCLAWGANTFAINNAAENAETKRLEDRQDRETARQEDREDRKKLETKVEKLETKVEKLETKVDDLTTKVDDLTTKVDDLQKNFEKLAGLPNQVDALRDTVETNRREAREDLQKLEGKVDGLTTKVDNLTTKVDGLSTQMGEVLGLLRTLAHRQDSVERREALREIQNCPPEDAPHDEHA